LGTWAQHAIATGLGGPFSSRVIDLDGDGDQDVVTNERDSDRVLWYENVDSVGDVWLMHMVDETSDGPNDVLAADVDGDLVPEIIASFSWDNSVVWYEPASDYAASGSLESSILDGGGPVPDWGTITWNCTAPAGTSVGMQVRAATGSGAMGAWIDVASSGDDLSDYIASGLRYFQYRVSLATTDAAISPRFQDISVQWEYISAVGEDDRAGSTRPSCFGASNPSQPGSATIKFTVPVAGEIELALYDVSGRKLATVAQGQYPAGEHMATVRGLASGVYLYALRMGEGRYVNRIVLP
jgi:hypothetical protein